MSAMVTQLRDAEEHALKMFQLNCRDNVMEVALDQGVYRHLRFRKPGSGLYWYDIITTPGQLTIRGDMATYVFARTEDMFTFFENNTGRINPGYWAEKLEAQDTYSPAREYSREVFLQHVIDDFWDNRDGLEDAADVWREIREEILDEFGPSGDEGAAIEAAAGFRYGGFEFSDVAGWRLTTYSHQYLYSLHAIVAGISQYRRHTASLQLAGAVA